MTEHLSRRTIERLSVGELDEAATTQAERHVAACDACRDRLQALHEDHDEFHGTVSAAALAREVVARFDRGDVPFPPDPERVTPPRRRTWVTASVLTAAACLLLYLRMGSLTSTPVGVSLTRGGAVRPFTAVDRLEPGDQLEVGSQGAAWVVDADDRVLAVHQSVTIDAPCRDRWLIIDRRGAPAQNDDDVRRLRRAPTRDVSVQALRCR